MKTIDLINDALREINVISEVQTASAEQGAYALRKLNQMMELWKENDIDFGWYKLPDTNGVVPIPDWAEVAVTLTLARDCAPKYGASLSLESASVGANAYNVVLRKSISEKIDNADMTHMPEGAGHNRARYNIEVDR